MCRAALGGRREGSDKLGEAQGGEHESQLGRLGDQAGVAAEGRG